MPLKLLSACRRPLIHPKSTKSQYRDIKTEWAAEHFPLCFNEPFKVLSTSTATLLAIITHEKYIVKVVGWLTVDCKLFHWDRVLCVSIVK